jgi:hypothetical protein
MFSMENLVATVSDDGIYSTVNISKGYPSVWSSSIPVQKEWLIRGLSRTKEMLRRGKLTASSAKIMGALPLSVTLDLSVF